MILRPIYSKHISEYIDKTQIKIITGIRRSGKSTFLRLLKNELNERNVLDEQIISINFESFNFSELTNAVKLHQFVKAKITQKRKYYLLFDEIQEVENWEKAINSFLVDFDVDIYITGSNSHLLSSELATYLAGRYVEIPVFTLSFKEYLTFRAHYLQENQEIKAAFSNFLRLGGFPVIHTAEYSEESAYKVVYDIYSSVILRDTIQRYKIRDVEILERVIKYAFDNVGNTFSGKNIADYFKSQQRKIDINTVYNYLHGLEGAFILHRVQRYDIKGKEILKTQEKFYASDVSLIYATMGFKDRMISGILENIVFLELKRRGYKVFIGKLYDKEIDFVAEKMGNKIYAQVTYKLENEQTIEREFGNLLAINDQYPKFVISMDERWTESVSGVKHFHIADFLLRENWD
jgi:hypothetical protein